MTTTTTGGQVFTEYQRNLIREATSNKREIRRLQRKLREGGRNSAATGRALDRRLQRDRELLAALAATEETN